MARNVTVVDHPLVQHKLTLMRRKETPTAQFRALVREISLLLGYEVTRGLPLADAAIETPLAPTRAPVLDGKKLCLISVLRAGNGILDGMFDLVPSARVGHVGLYRDPATLEAVEYYYKVPGDLGERLVIVVDPMLATGNSATAAVARLKIEWRAVDQVRLSARRARGYRGVRRGTSRRAHRYRRHRRTPRRPRLHRPRPRRRRRPHLRDPLGMAAARGDAAVPEIPVLDLGPYRAGKRGALDRIGAELRAACETIGFYFIEGHGVSQDLVDRTFAEAARFHALPLDAKMALRANQHNVGYMPVRGSTTPQLEDQPQQPPQPGRGVLRRPRPSARPP